MFFKKLLGNKKIFLILAAIFSSILMISPAFAAPGDYTPLVKIPGVNANAGLFDYLSGIYSFLISIVGIMAMAVLVYGGMRYITSAGNTASVQEAKESIESALAGLLLALVSWLIFATINKDILVLKNPGVGLPNSPYSYGATKSCIAAPGSGTQNDPCKCIDDPKKPIYGTGGDCNKICSDPSIQLPQGSGVYHCLKADLRVGNTFKPFGDVISVRVGETVYFDARTYSADYGYPNLKINVPSDGPGFDNGVDRYEIDFTTPWLGWIADYAKSETTNCDTLLGVLGSLGNALFDTRYTGGMTSTSYSTPGKYEGQVRIISKNGCHGPIVDRVQINVNP